MFTSIIRYKYLLYNFHFLRFNPRVVLAFEIPIEEFSENFSTDNGFRFFSPQISRTGETMPSGVVNAPSASRS